MILRRRTSWEPCLLAVEFWSRKLTSVISPFKGHKEDNWWYKCEISHLDQMNCTKCNYPDYIVIEVFPPIYTYSLNEIHISSFDELLTYKTVRSKWIKGPLWKWNFPGAPGNFRDSRFLKVPHFIFVWDKMNTSQLRK